jgi:hypothetical protein
MRAEHRTLYTSCRLHATVLNAPRRPPNLDQLSSLASAGHGSSGHPQAQPATHPCAHPRPSQPPTPPHRRTLPHQPLASAHTHLRARPAANRLAVRHRSFLYVPSRQVCIPFGPPSTGTASARSRLNHGAWGNACTVISPAHEHTYQDLHAARPNTRRPMRMPPRPP